MPAKSSGPDIVHETMPGICMSSQLGSEEIKIQAAIDGSRTYSDHDYVHVSVPSFDIPSTSIFYKNDPVAACVVSICTEIKRLSSCTKREKILVLAVPSLRNTHEVL